MSLVYINLLLTSSSYAGCCSSWPYSCSSTGSYSAGEILISNSTVETETSYLWLDDLFIGVAAAGAR